MTLTLEPSIWVSLLTYKLEDNVKEFYLAINILEDKRKSTNWTASYPVGYSTTGDFLGIVGNFPGWNGETNEGIYLKFTYWNSRWHKYRPLSSPGDAGSGWIYPGSATEYYGSFPSSISCWEKNVVIYEDYYDAKSGPHYKIAYSRDDYRGRHCGMGNYDSRNCLVGTPPSGTQAFIYSFGANATYFYYTPLPGNVCPVGNGFDGANCQYMLVPDNYSPFIVGNSFYVRTDKL